MASKQKRAILYFSCGVGLVCIYAVILFKVANASSYQLAGNTFELIDHQDGSFDLSSNSKKISHPFWNYEHLSVLEPFAHIFDSKFANKLAQVARRQSKLFSQKGYCLRSVRHSLNTTNTFFYSFNELFFNLNNLPNDPKIRKNYYPGKSAENFRKWAKDNPLTLCKELHLVNITNLPKVPIHKGHIYFYKKGTYGFHKKHGHVEIVVKESPLIACSNKCTEIPAHRKPHLVLAPVKDCSSIMLYQQKSKISKLLTENKAARAT